MGIPGNALPRRAPRESRAALRRPRGPAIIAAGRITALGLAVLSVLVALGVLLDRHGLRTEYFQLSTKFQGPPVFTHLEETLGLDEAGAGLALRELDFFSVRWTGWLRIEQSGAYRFLGEPRRSVYVLVDSEPVFGASGSTATSAAGKRMPLTEGLHRIEIGYTPFFEPVAMQVTWSPPSGRRKGASEFERIPSALLFAQRPGWLRQVFRSALAELPDLRKKALGSALALGGLVLFWLGSPLLAGARQRARALLEPLHARRPRLLYPLGFAGLFGASMAAIFPFTTGLMGYDDTYYMWVADRGIATSWILNRYVHVYLLKFFAWLGDGSFLAGSRLLWSFVFAVTVTSLAVAARAAAPRQPVTTFALALFMLFAQPLFFIRMGTAVPDYPTAMFVIVAVALYLTRIRRRSAPAFEWHALWIGVVTVAAIKSKELGVILLWLPLLFVFERGKLDLPRFRRKILAWIGGAFAAYLLLMTLDGWLLGDFFFSLRTPALRDVIGYNLGRPLETETLGDTWIFVLWQGATVLGLDDSRMKYLAVAVVLAAVLATARRRPLELRLLHLMPLVYVLMLVVLRQRATYALMERYLYPIMPVAALCVALGLSYLGFDRLRWRVVGSPLFFLPAGALAFLLLAVVVPYQLGLLGEAEFLPAALLANLQFGSPDLLMRSNLAPALVIVALCLLVAFYRRLTIRLLVVASLLLFTFGMPFSRTLFELRNHSAIQRAESILYPLRVFGDEIEVDHGTSIWVSPNVQAEHDMLIPVDTYTRIVDFYFQRRLEVSNTGWWQNKDYALFTADDLERLRRENPELAASARTDPSGVLALIEPRRFFGQAKEAEETR